MLYFRRGGEKQITAADNHQIKRAGKFCTVLPENFAQAAAGQIAVNGAVADFFTRHHPEPERGILPGAKPEHHKATDKILFLCKSLPEEGGLNQALFFGKRF